MPKDPEKFPQRSSASIFNNLYDIRLFYKTSLFPTFYWIYRIQETLKTDSLLLQLAKPNELTAEKLQITPQKILEFKMIKPWDGFRPINSSEKNIPRVKSPERYNTVNRTFEKKKRLFQPFFRNFSNSTLPEEQTALLFPETYILITERTFRQWD